MNRHSDNTPQWSIGLMTGTVLDGNIDIALIKTDGETIVERGPYELAPYDSALNTLLQKTLEAAKVWNFEGPEPDIFAEAENTLTIAQSYAVLAFLKSHGISTDAIGSIGFHGQTVLHRPPTANAHGMTRQLGDGALMASITNIAVVHDFRTEDMRHGGQGAPLASVYHAALLSDLFTDKQTTSEDKHHAGIRHIESTSKLAVLNLGGVSNVSWTDGNKQLIGFDTGPANAPINDWIKHQSDSNAATTYFDENGKTASAGTVDETRLATLLEHPYLSTTYPKSLDRFDFGYQMANGCSFEDGAALLTAFSAAAVGCALDLLPDRPDALIVCGGGRHNPVLMKELQLRAGVTVIPAESVGWSGDAIEAECFAFLAVRHMRQLPISFPSTTGADREVSGGIFNLPN